MYTQTTAARISHSWLVSDASYAPDAPRNVMVTPGGNLISSAAWRMASTADPSDTPAAASKPIVVAGYWATWVICSGARRRAMLAIDDNGTASPDAVRSVAGVTAASGSVSRITPYWLVSVKMVETMRWPKAL